MTYEIERAKEELIDALDKLNESAMGDAKDQLLNQSKKLADYLFVEATCGWGITVAGLDWKAAPGDLPLTVYVHDFEGDGLLFTWDPIEVLIERHVPWNMSPDRAPAMFSGEEAPPEDLEIEAIQGAIAALQSGMDRLKAHAAFRGIEVA